MTALEKLLKLDSQYILEQLHQPWVSEGLYVPLTVLAPEEEKLIDRLLQIPGVMINEVERRYYPLGAATAHLIGYLGEVTAQELEDNRGKGLHAGDLIGKTGLEATQEENLAGKRGYTLRILGADGDEAAVIAHQEPVDGQDVALLSTPRCKNMPLRPWEIGGRCRPRSAHWRNTGPLQQSRIRSQPFYSRAKRRRMEQAAGG